MEGRVGVVNSAVLTCVLRTTTKKGSSTFFRKEAHPQILAMGHAAGAIIDPADWTVITLLNCTTTVMYRKR